MKGGGGREGGGVVREGEKRGERMRSQEKEKPSTVMTCAGKCNKRSPNHEQNSNDGSCFQIFAFSPL